MRQEKSKTEKQETDEARIERLERFFNSTDFEQHQARIAEAFKAKVVTTRNEREVA